MTGSLVDLCFRLWSVLIAVRGMGEASFVAQLQLLSAEQLENFRGSLAHFQGLKAPNARSRTALIEKATEAFGEHAVLRLRANTSYPDSLIRMSFFPCSHN